MPDTTATLLDGFIDKLERQIRGDDRIVAAYVVNPRDRTYCGSTTDLKLVVACRREAYEELTRGLSHVVNAVQPVAWGLAETYQWPIAPSGVVTDRGIQIDFLLFKADFGKWQKPVIRILKSSPDYPEPPLEEPHGRTDPASVANDARLARLSATSFWRSLATVTRAMRNHEPVVAYAMMLQSLQWLITCLADRPAQADRPSARPGRRLAPDDDSAIVAALGSGPPTLPHIARQVRGLAAVMSERGRQIFEMVGAEYPDALEEAIRVALDRDLAELGFGL